jgi:hypothetical protein
MMPRTCTVCSHEDRAGIDSALLAGDTLRNIAKRTGTSPTTLHRHKEEHISTLLLKAQEVEEMARADNLLDQVKAVQARTLSILDRADNAGDLKTALAAIRETRGNLELLAKLTGDLDERTQINFNTQFVQLQEVIVEALAPYPEAEEAVLAALEAVPDDG